MAMNNVAIIGAGIQGSMITFRNAVYGKKVSLFDPVVTNPYKQL